MSYLRGMFYLVVVVAAVTMTVAATEAEDEEFSVGESEVRVEAESGMMEFRRRRREMDNGTDEIRPVQIRMARLVQLDKDGNEVTNCSVASTPTDRTTTVRRKRAGRPVVTRKTMRTTRGGLKQPKGFKKPSPWVGGNGTGWGRRFSDFAKTHFKIEKKKAHQQLKFGRNALKALKKRFHAKLGEDVGKMEIDMALPENDGEIDIDGEKQKLKKGDLKFNIELSDWSWCGEEGDEGAAAFLDLYVEVNSTRPPGLRRQRTPSTPASFDLGDNTTMSFSGKFERDDRLVSVVDGYPKVDSEDPTLIVVRFTRFNSSLFYDPTVTVESEENAEENDDKNGNSNDSRCLGASVMFVTMTTGLAFILLK